MLGQARPTVPRCVSLRGTRRLRSPLAVQLSVSPARCCDAERLPGVGDATQAPISGARAPLLRCRAGAASVADGADDAARVDGEAFVKELRGKMTPDQLKLVERPVNSRNLRKAAKVWEVVAALCFDGVKLPERVKRLDKGVRCALAVCGYVLVPGSIGETPMEAKGLNYSHRQVKVWRDGVRSKPTRLKHLLTGHSGVSTTEERDAVNADKRVQQKARMPKGVATSNNDQAAHLTALWTLLGLSTSLQLKRASEAVRASYAISKIGDKEADAAWLGMKVATAVAHPITGQFAIGITVSTMRKCLKDGLCVLLIGLDGNQLSVAYPLHGQEALNMLDSVPEESDDAMFKPRLDPTQCNERPGGLPDRLKNFSNDLRDPTGRAKVSAALLDALATGMLQPLLAFIIADPCFEQVRGAFVHMVHRDWTMEVCNNWDSVDYELKRIGTTVRVLNQYRSKT